MKHLAIYELYLALMGQIGMVVLSYKLSTWPLGCEDMPIVKQEHYCNELYTVAMNREFVKYWYLM